MAGPADRLQRPDLVAAAGLVAIAAYFALLMHGLGSWPYAEWMVILLVPLLFATGAAVIVALTRDDEVPLTRLIVLALAVKLAASFVRYHMVSLYGTGDAIRYDTAGVEIARSFRQGDTTLTELLSLHQGTKFIEDLTGVLYTVMGDSRMGGFIVYSFVAFWGLFLFHRAALTGLPEGDQRRYALLVLFVPSLVFWPSSIGKEAVMMLALGLCAWGAARLLERERPGRASIALAAGAGLGYMVRPHVIAVVLAALAVAMLVRRQRAHPPVLGPVGRVVTVVALIGGMAFLLGQSFDRFLRDDEPAPTSTAQGVGELLDRAASGTESGDSEIGRSSPNSPLDYPRAAFTVLFRPSVFDATTARYALGAVETTFVLVLAVASRRRLRNLPVIAFRRPYVTFCIVYSGIFVFGWSSFTNLGAIARQRVQVLPFVLLLLVVPAAARARSSRPVTTTRAPREPSRG